MRPYSSNMNGLRAAATWLSDWLARTQPDVLRLQERRSGPDDLPEDARRPAGNTSGWAPAAQRGCSGCVATFCRTPPRGLARRWRVNARNA
jgi:exodeoxyribonuclease-3